MTLQFAEQFVRYLRSIRVAPNGHPHTRKRPLENDHLLITEYDTFSKPNIPCTSVFEDYEWQPVWRIVTKTELPTQPPLLSEFMRLLSSLGGYNNRTSEPPPGPQPIWIGLRRMVDFAKAWLAFGPPTRTYV